MTKGKVDKFALIKLKNFLAAHHEERKHRIGENIYKSN